MVAEILKSHYRKQIDATFETLPLDGGPHRSFGFSDEARGTFEGKRSDHSLAVAEIAYIGGVETGLTRTDITVERKEYGTYVTYSEKRPHLDGKQHLEGYDKDLPLLKIRKVARHLGKIAQMLEQNAKPFDASEPLS